MTKLSEFKTIPTALRRGDAAMHCGVSPTYFDKMVDDGIMPQPRQFGEGVKVWLRDELDSALFCLPAAEAARQVNPCDRLLA
jgi:predicted DNA-binding transcriptional regulator AlpA